MSATNFTQHTEIRHLIKELKKDCQNKIFSNIIDDAGKQYVDLVMEGGGVLGIALVGYTYILEEIGIRFLGIGGTSAGSINALMLASLAPPAKRKSKKIVKLLATLPIHEFIDGDSDAKGFIDAMLAKAGKFKLGLKALKVLDNIFKDLGLNPGQRFQEYISGVLQDAGIATTYDLKQRLATPPPGLHTRDGKTLTAKETTATLTIVAADISTETKVEFPKMAPLYWEKPDEVDPALYVRASMSIPYFFHPFRVRNIPNDEAAREKWKKLASYDDTPPSTIVFVDGGIMSNFPINLFHQSDTVPLAPTFGAKLGSGKRQRQIINTPTQLGAAIFNSARHCLDYDFIIRHPDYKHLVTYIDTDSHDWLNFNIKQKEQIELFIKGAKAAAAFLRQFNWENYREVRQQLIVRKQK